MMKKKEEVKRLEPTVPTLRALYYLSGNNCAYEWGNKKCENMLFDFRDGSFIGEVCHIEAASEKGERFNINMTNESRRHIDNLILLCGNCHIITNNVAVYTVEKLQHMKHTHEARFKTEMIVQRMGEQFKDLSKEKHLIEAENLNRFYDIVLNHDWRDIPDFEENSLILTDMFNKMMKGFSTLSADAKEFTAICLEHAEYIDGKEDQYGVYPEVIKSNVRGWSREAKSMFDELMKKKLMNLRSDLNDADIMVFCCPIDRVSGNELYDIWGNITEYCKKEKLDLNNFLLDLDFSSFAD